ncbi:MAG: hypothetical protein KAV82_11180 [Phycisphaerae bacterium]|nr:hypothetical protein [Phycisphaerae bacterium]
MLWAPVALALWAGGPVRADEITTHDAHYVKIKIIDFSDGLIRFRRPAGDLCNVSVLRVRALLVDTVGGVKDLNEAELYIDKGQPFEAVRRYKRALNSARGFWRWLVRVRLLQACDQAGELDEAVVHWLAVVKRDTALAAELLPGCVPATRTRVVDRALSDIEAKLPQVTDESGRRLLELLRYSIYRRLGDKIADEMALRVARSPLAGPISTVPAYGIWTDALRRVFEMRRNRQVLARLDGALEHCPEGSLPRLLLLKGEVLYTTARAREDYIRSGWAFMRVPIHFPDDPSAVRGLLWAARVHEKIDAPGKAVELLRECLAVESADAETRTKAEAALRGLTSERG